MRKLAIIAVIAVACGHTPPPAGGRHSETRPLASAPSPVTAAAQVAPSGPRTAALRVGGDVTAPVILRRVDPVYPQYRGSYQQGILLVECVITKEGDVTDLRVVKGPGNSFERAVLEAMKQWKFKPGSLHGEPVDVVFHLTVNHVPYGPGG